jgi:ubiquinone/menaquinone biosynthesis C-methylase UbiE
MNRTLTNAIRFCTDELIPPIIRDSWWFMLPFYWLAYRGKLVRKAMEFKSRLAEMTPKEYVQFYESIDTISRNRQSDLNSRCVEAILGALSGGHLKILDAGCGNGFLLRAINARCPKAQLYGLDLTTPRRGIPGKFTRGSLTSMPFSDNAFDVVICTHTLEHCLRLERAVQELIRVARSELIVVVPKQRPYYYTVDDMCNFSFIVSS